MRYLPSSAQGGSPRCVACSVKRADALPSTEEDGPESTRGRRKNLLLPLFPQVRHIRGENEGRATGPKHTSCPRSPTIRPWGFVSLSDRWNDGIDRLVSSGDPASARGDRARAHRHIPLTPSACASADAQSFSRQESRSSVTFFSLGFRWNHPLAAAKSHTASP